MLATSVWVFKPASALGVNPLHNREYLSQALSCSDMDQISSRNH